jgi:acyl-CoA synthetase (AMP-forming)/AMP-acid ligase II
VAIVMRNFPEWPVAFFGATIAGAIVTPLNAWWTGSELEYGLTDSGSKILIVDAERMERLREHLAAIGSPVGVGVGVGVAAQGTKAQRPDILDGEKLGDIDATPSWKKVRGQCPFRLRRARRRVVFGCAVRMPK